MHRSTGIWGNVAFVSLFFAATGAQGESPRPTAPPRWEFFPRSVAVSGLAPGAKVAWFSISREFYDYGLSVRQRGGLVTDTDQDGTEAIELDRELSPASIWGAVDFAAGTFALAQPSGAPVDLVAIHGNPRSALRKIDFEDRDFLYAFLVRPDVGAWWARIGDGSPDDEDGEIDRRIALPLSAMSPFDGSTPPPDRIERNDLIFAIDPNRLDVFAAGVRE